MNRKFARLSYAASREDISLKYKIIKKAPAKFFDWYVYKFNPYKMEETYLLGQHGYNVKLPLLPEQAEADTVKAESIIQRTIASLADHNVEIILPPYKTELSYINKVSVATGCRILPFFLPQAVHKALKTVRKDIKTAEILVLAGGENTESVLYNIYEELNYLSVMIPNGDASRYAKAAEEIFDDTGLNIQFTSINKSVINSADIVINIDELDEKQFFSFKRGAVLFDLCGSRKNRVDLMRKRDDMLVVDDFRIKTEDGQITLAEFEAAFYLMCREYRMLFLRGYDPHTADSVKKSLRELDASVIGFVSLERAIGHAAIANFLRRM